MLRQVSVHQPLSTHLRKSNNPDLNYNRQLPHSNDATTRARVGQARRPVSSGRSSGERRTTVSGRQACLRFQQWRSFAYLSPFARPPISNSGVAVRPDRSICRDIHAGQDERRKVCKLETANDDEIRLLFHSPLATKLPPICTATLPFALSRSPASYK